MDGITLLEDMRHQLAAQLDEQAALVVDVWAHYAKLQQAADND